MSHWNLPRKKSKYDALETLEIIKRLWDATGLGDDPTESERAYAGLLELIEREKKSRGLLKKTKLTAG